MRPLVAVLAGLALLLAGCGDDDEREAGAPADATRLQVEVTGAGSKPIQMQLVCSGRCDMQRLRRALTGAEDRERACTLQYGGPEKAHATGTVAGRPVDVTLDRADGCGIADYDALFAAFGREPPVAR